MVHECHERLVGIIGLLPRLQTVSAITGISTPIISTAQSHPSLRRIGVFTEGEEFSLPEDLKTGDDAGKMSKFRGIADSYGHFHTDASISSHPSLRRAVLELGMRIEGLRIDAQTAQVLNPSSPDAQLLQNVESVYISLINAIDRVELDGMFVNLYKLLRTTAQDVNRVVVSHDDRGGDHLPFNNWITRRVLPVLTGASITEAHRKVNISSIAFDRVEDTQTSSEVEWEVSALSIRAELGREDTWNYLQNLLAACNTVRDLNVQHEHPQGQATGLILHDFVPVSSTLFGNVNHTHLICRLSRLFSLNL